jgi:hypothetical protein
MIMRVFFLVKSSECILKAGQDTDVNFSYAALAAAVSRLLLG